MRSHPEQLTRACACAVLFSCLLSACGEQQPVAGISSPSSPQLPYPSFTELVLELEPEVGVDALGDEPYVFVHVTDPESGQILQTFDQRLEVRDWAVGRSVDQAIQLFQSALAPPLEPGAYPIFVGLYDGESNKFPLRVSGDTATDGRYRYQLATLRVTAPGPMPVTEWGPEWLPTRHTGDRQVSVVRILDGSGRVKLRTLTAPAELLIELEIPVAARAETESPALTISSNCTDQPTVVAGFGLYRLSFRLTSPGGEEDEACFLEFSPNYRPPDEPEAESMLPVLRVLSWREA